MYVGCKNIYVLLSSASLSICSPLNIARQEEGGARHIHNVMHIHNVRHVHTVMHVHDIVLRQHNVDNILPPYIPLVYYTIYTTYYKTYIRYIVCKNVPCIYTIRYIPCSPMPSVDRNSFFLSTHPGTTRKQAAAQMGASEVPYKELSDAPNMVPNANTGPSCAGCCRCTGTVLNIEPCTRV